MGRKLLSATLLILMALSLGANIAYAALSVSTNKFTYNIGESVTITVSGASATSRLMVQINNPSGKPVDLWETTVSTVGSYSFSWKTSDTLSVGLYKILIKDQVTGQLAITTFYLTSYTPPPSPPPPPPAEDIADLPPEDAADVVEDLAPEDAADLVEDLDTETAADIFEEMDVEAAAYVVEEVSFDTAADIFEEMDVVAVADIVEEVSVETVADVFEVMNVSTATDVIEEITVETSSDIVIEMDDDDADAVGGL